MLEEKFWFWVMWDGMVWYGLGGGVLTYTVRWRGGGVVVVKKTCAKIVLGGFWERGFL